VLAFQPLKANSSESLKYQIQRPLGALQVDNLTIFTIFQDLQGFIWLGTSDGVLRYDGYEFKSVNADFKQLEVWSIIQDSNKDLWFGTRNKGLVKQSHKNQHISYFQYDKNKPNSLSHNNIRKLLLSKEGEIYIATSGGGLNKFNAQSQNFQRIPLNRVADPSILYLRDIVEGDNGELWIATRGHGVIKLNPKINQLTYYQSRVNDSNTLSSNIIQALSFDEANKNLWIGTWGGGLNFLDTDTGKVRRFYQASGEKQKLGPQTVVSMMRGKNNDLWLGTLNEVVYFDVNNEQFHYVKDEYPQFSTLGQAAYYALMCDKFGSIWLGSWRGKLHFLASEGDTFQLDDLTQYFPGTINAKSISAVLITDAGDMWLGTETSGVIHLDENRQLIKHYQHQAKSGNSLTDNAITTIMQQKNGDIWFGTMNGGLDKYQRGSDDFVSFMMLGKTRTGASRYISEIFEYKGGLLIGTASGLFKFDVETNEATQVTLLGDASESISNALVSTIFLDSHLRLWLATTEGLFIQKTNKAFELVLSFSELSTNSDENFTTISAITEDKQKNIWLATNTGLWQATYRINSEEEAFLSLNKYLSADLSGMQLDSRDVLWLVSNNNLYRFTPDNKQHETFSILDGIKGNFNSGAYFLATDDEMFFGSSYGLLSFKAALVSAKEHTVEVTIGDLLLANKSVQANATSSILTKPIYQTKHLTLPYSENVISFDISALDFRQPNKVLYQYRLLGFDEDWVENTAKNRRITYTNLKSGEYTLSVRGAYSFNPVWGDSTDLSITILPPIWWTLWAKLLYIIIVLTLLRVSYSVHKHRVLFIAYEQAALTDSLTGLKNRRFLESTIDQDISQSMLLKKENTANCDVTFFFADIDNFKEVNDDYGHESGDLVLKQFANLLQEVYRSSDHIIRWGGEEFLIVSRFSQANRAKEIAERLRIKVSNTEFEISNGDKIHKTVSIGYTTIPFDRAATCRLSCSQLIEVADKALYFVKEHGRNGWAGISAGDNFELKNFNRIGSFDLDEKVKSGEIQLVHKLSKPS